MELDEITLAGEGFNKVSNDCEVINPDSQIIHGINEDINFIFNGVGIAILTLFGISANLLSVLVLTHPKLKSSLTTLLLGLTISDIFVIGTSFCMFSLPKVFIKINTFSYYTSHIQPHLIPWLLPIALTAQMSSIYFTVIITLERYIAVCLPLKARSLCTRSSAKRSFITIVVLSTLYNIPRWFEYRTVQNKLCSNETTSYRDTETDLRLNEKYVLYYVNWGYLIVFYLIPFTVLVYFNIVIYKVTKYHRFRRNSLSPTRSNSINEDTQLAGMLLGIVITFLLCNMLALVINVMESLGMKNIGDLIPINNFLIICSSSSNFIFYFAFGTEFRKRLKRTIRIKQERDPRKDSCISNTNTEPSSSSRIHRGSRQSCLVTDNDRNNNGNRNSNTASESCTNGTNEDRRTIPNLSHNSTLHENDEIDISEFHDTNNELSTSFSGSRSTVQTII